MIFWILSATFNGSEATLKQERIAHKNFFIPKNAEVLSDRLLLPHIVKAEVFPTLRAQAVIRDFKPHIEAVVFAYIQRASKIHKKPPTRGKKFIVLLRVLILILRTP